MAKKTDWFSLLAEFVRQHPKTSATIAFNLGVVAAQAAKRGKALADGATDIPAKLIELVPSMRDLGNYVPLLGGKPRQKPKRRAVATRARKPARKTAARRKAAE